MKIRFLVFLFLCSGISYAQTESQLENSAATFRSDVALVRIDASVTENGQPITGLTQQDFIVYDEGQIQPLQYFSSGSEPLSLLLLLDVSGSMKQYLQQMASTATSALRHLRTDDQVAVMLFSRRSAVTQPFTSDSSRVRDAIRQAAGESELGGGTLIYTSAIAAAEELAKESPGNNGRRALLILTDNVSMEYQVPEVKVVEALLRVDAAANAIVVGKGERPEKPKQGQQLNPDFILADVFSLTEQTGGETIKANRVEAEFGAMVQRIRARYQLQYKSPQAVAGSFRRLRVELTPAARQLHPQAVIRARPGYYVQ